MLIRIDYDSSPVNDSLSRPNRIGLIERLREPIYACIYERRMLVKY